MLNFFSLSPSLEAICKGPHAMIFKILENEDFEGQGHGSALELSSRIPKTQPPKKWRSWSHCSAAWCPLLWFKWNRVMSTWSFRRKQGWWYRQDPGHPCSNSGSASDYLVIFPTSTSSPSQADFLLSISFHFKTVYLYSMLCSQT